MLNPIKKNKNDNDEVLSPHVTFLSGRYIIDILRAGIFRMISTSFLMGLLSDR